MNIQPLLSASGLFKMHHRKEDSFAALNGVDLHIHEGETLALVGPSGSGKSTLARIILRLIEPDAGTLRFDGHDLLAQRGAALRSLRQKFQMVFQEPLAAFNPRATVRRVLDDPLRIHKLVSPSARNEAVESLLEQVQLTRNLLDRRIHEISGGQRQRVAIARAIATNPKLIVLDEAVSALDVSVRAGILDLLTTLQRARHIACLFISHDLAVVQKIAHRIAVMDAGRIVETGTCRDVFASPQSTMMRALLEASLKLPVSPNSHESQGHEHPINPRGSVEP